MKTVIIGCFCIVGMITTLRAQWRPISDDTTIVYDVSMVQLIASPEKYHAKNVQVIGYLNLEFEGDAIYLHKEDCQVGLSLNGLWVEFSKQIQQTKKIEDYSKQYVIIVGRFDMYSRGHESAFGGKIRAITRLDRWVYQR